MSTTIEDKQVEYDGLVKAICDISDKATDEKRALTDEEHEKASELYQQAKTLKDEMAKDRSKSGLMDSIRELGRVHSPDEEKKNEDRNTKSWGAQFVEAAEYKRTVDGGFKGNWTTGPFELKATLTEGGGSGATLIQPDVQPGILPLLFRRLVVADLMPSGQTNSNVVRYLKELTATNAAATTAEGAPKPESALTFDLVDEPVRKIATFLPVSDEMLEDVAQIATFIDNRLRLFVLLTEEDQLLNGNGTAPNLSGILDRGGVQSQAVGGDTEVDAIYKAITKVRTVSFLEPDGLVVHPSDWQAIRLSKDQNDQYYGGGPFTGAYGNGGIPGNTDLWQLRAVVTPAIAEGTALVGAFGQAAQVFRRGGLTVEASNSHADFFQKNLTAIRAEERLALAVYRETAFCKVTGLVAGS